MAAAACGASVPPKNDTEVTCASFTLSKNYWICRATNSVNGFRRREALQLEIPTLTHHALTDAQDALNSLQERGGSLAAAGMMFLALILGCY